MRTLILAACMAILVLPGLAEDNGNGAKETPDIPEAQSFTSDHTLRLGSKTVKYKTVAGETYLRDNKDEPTASVFSVSYVDTSTSSAAQRPVTFVFNGGPGSASLWLHMGAFGPKQVLTPSDASDVGAPPYTMRDNPNSLLDVTDLVFIDPVGTGYSRPLGETEGKEFYGVNEDAESIAEFIRIWLTENGRWNSPKYLAGESYGTTRAAALTEKLQGGWNGIGLNGVILISAILDFQTARFAPGNDTAHLAFFPTEAATAWHHGKANKAKWNNDFDAFIEDARNYATDTLAPALIRGSTLSEADETRIAQEMSDFIGLSPEWIRLANLRVDPHRFRKELLRREGYTVGRFDSRYKGVDSEGTGETPENDPSGYGMDVAYVAAINDYLTRELEVDFTRPYKVLTGEPGSQWNWSTSQQGWPAYVNVTPWLGKGMRENTELRVLLASGWYDLATPFFGAEMALRKNGVVLDRVQFDYYDAGHMMYLAESDGKKLSDDVRDFIKAGQ
ncbi:peptidase S10 [uncultured Hyphomonas sp.]|jgi:carboxypeptidase C (cathepsin A)|uniref:S10 family peptidase n=1 Tax=uncultured Hyphomonas sp. TaxID=225298 RepID=UPI000C378A00|nr:peptidase S10 [Hyphomonadaceae bacterium]|tara:strand:+ start:57861 stop:59372 length:1512 start_codon:yes stop_codon:yes gene_type:complete